MLASLLAAVTLHATDIPALVQKVKPAVVEILTFDQQNKLLKTGTGFFISPDGLLLTNYHVISGGSSIMAKTPSGAVYVFKSFVATSETYDVAELQFFATDVPYLTMGSSLSAVEGQRVLVIGNPEGLEGTVSDGIISAFRAGRTMIQITAPVSAGSSGSPVLDESGKVLGIATQIYKKGQNLNFAISSEAITSGLTAAQQTAATPQSTPVKPDRLAKGSQQTNTATPSPEFNAATYALSHPSDHYCTDYARLLRPTTAERIDKQLEAFERATSNQLVVAIFPELPDAMTVEDYGIQLGRAAKIGQKEKDKGALLLVFVKNRTIRIETSRDLERALPDAVCKRIISDQIAPRFRAGDFDEGITEGVGAIMTAVKVGLNE
jgi:hypothetical protein